MVIMTSPSATAPRHLGKAVLSEAAPGRAYIEEAGKARGQRRREKAPGRETEVALPFSPGNWPVDNHDMDIEKGTEVSS